MQRNKGAAGERELAVLLTEMGFIAQRSARNGVDQAEDIHHDIPGVHVECKRTEALRLHEAMAQAIEAAKAKIPTLWTRRNRGEWLVILRARDLRLLVRVLSEVLEAKR